MSTMNRRGFIKILGGTAVLGSVGFPMITRSGAKAKVVVIGGGYGGTIAAKYTRLYDSGIDVTLIEQAITELSNMAGK